MFNAIATTETLEQFVDTAHALVDEANIHLHDNTLRLAAVDPANVAMVEQTLGAAAFESYDADGGVIGVNLERLGDVLSMGDSDSLVHLELDEETRKLHIEVDGLSYTLALIDPDAIRSEPDIPDLDTAGSVTIEGRDLHQAVTACDLVSDHITLGFAYDGADGTLYAEATGDTDDVRVELEDDDLLDGSFVAEAETMASLEYMNDLKKPIGADTEVELDIGSEVPVKIHYGYANGNGVVTNMVAPRIKSD
jgi:proliferating cell nuclear antigen